MRRNEKEITDPAQIEQIIRSCTVCRLGLSDNGQPYVVPVCFGYAQGTVYIHCAHTGKKLDIIAGNPRVCVEFDTGAELVQAPGACGYGMHYRSVIGFGTVRTVLDPDEKARALNAIMRQYTGRDFVFNTRESGSVTVLAVRCERVSGKAG